ncbi:MAG: PfkB family carbohydrate kinase, partial [Verrucomicrobia bacterium]|nr:PfkB family carbohydrate kinase [Verrucomicrobiota bacterium]
SSTFEVQVTSAESNVGSIISYLGKPVKVLTSFVKDSPISRMIKDNLAQRHMDFEGVERAQENPWGYRHQITFADIGSGARGPRVWNSRAGEVARDMSAEDFDLDKLFGEDGVQIVHLSGLVAAVSPQTTQLCLELARKAKEHGTLVSFDLNHRASFWVGREQELADSFAEIAGLTDILIGNEEDFQLCLGFKGPEAGGKDISATIDSFKDMINQVKEAYPNASVYATTLREVVHSNLHLWGAIIAEGDNWHVVNPREIAVQDRIGGGDGFVGGMLYAILQGWAPEQWIKFGWASGAMVTTFLTDYGQPADEEQIWSIWHGNARVKR